MQPTDGHRPRIDLSSAAGRAILELFTTIKDGVEREDGSWPGADVVDALSGWLRGIGIDPDSPAHTLPRPTPPACEHDRVNVEFATVLWVILTRRRSGDGVTEEVSDVVYSDEAASSAPTGGVFCTDCDQTLPAGHPRAAQALTVLSDPATWPWPAGRVGSL
jgi:hypothetical protein